MLVIRTNTLINESFSPTDEMLRNIGVDPDEYHRRLSEARSMTLDDLAERLGCAPPAHAHAVDE